MSFYVLNTMVLNRNCAWIQMSFAGLCVECVDVSGFFFNMIGSGGLWPSGSVENPWWIENINELLNYW